MKFATFGLAALLTVITAVPARGTSIGAENPYQSAVICTGGDETTGTLPVTACDASGGQELAAAAQQSQSDTWTWGGGIRKTVTTDRHDNEPVAAWNKRHKEAVTSALLYFPPDPIQSSPAGTNGAHGDTLYASWFWRSDVGDTRLSHTLAVTRAPGMSIVDWQKTFREDLARGLKDFRRVS